MSTSDCEASSETSSSSGEVAPTREVQGPEIAAISQATAVFEGG